MSTVMKRLALISLLLLVGCSDDRAKQFVEQQGYTNVYVEDSSYFKCPGDGEIGTSFTADSPLTLTDSRHHIVHGWVCYDPYRSGSRYLRFY